MKTVEIYKTVPILFDGTYFTVPISEVLKVTDIEFIKAFIDINENIINMINMFTLVSVLALFRNK